MPFVRYRMTTKSSLVRPLLSLHWSGSDLEPPLHIERNRTQIEADRSLRGHAVFREEVPEVINTPSNSGKGPEYTRSRCPSCSNRGLWRPTTAEPVTQFASFATVTLQREPGPRLHLPGHPYFHRARSNHGSCFRPNIPAVAEATNKGYSN